MVNVSNYHRLIEGLDANSILNLMSTMRIKKRERDSNLCKFNNLNEGWLKKEFYLSFGTNTTISASVM